MKIVVEKLHLNKEPEPLNNMQLSRPSHAALYPTFRIFFLSFSVDCKEVPLQWQMVLIDV